VSGIWGKLCVRQKVLRTLCVFSAAVSTKHRWDTQARNQPCPKAVGVVRNPAGGLKLLLIAGVVEMGQ